MNYQLTEHASGELRVDRDGMEGFKVVNSRGLVAVTGEEGATFFKYRDADKAREWAHDRLGTN